MLAPVQVQTFSFNGRTIHYQTLGRGDPIILIHGLSGSGHWWKYNIPALAQHYQVFVVELMGYGKARRQRSGSVLENAAIVSQWIESLDLHHVTLIGHSMGGHIAVHVAARQTLRVTALVLACASGLLRGHPVRTALRLPKAGAIGRKRFIPRVLLDSARAGLPNVWRNTVNLLNDNVAEIIPKLNTRTLVIWGERDVLVPAALGRRLAAAIPGAVYHQIPRAGHVVMVDAPAEFNATVLNFLGCEDVPM